MKKIFTTVALFCTVTLANAQWTSNTAENLKVANDTSINMVTVGTTDGRTYIAFYTPFQQGYFIRVQFLNDSGIRQFGDTGIIVARRRSDSLSTTFAFNACVDTGHNLIVAFQYEKGGIQRVVIQKITPKGKTLW